MKLQARALGCMVAAVGSLPLLFGGCGGGSTASSPDTDSGPGTPDSGSHADTGRPPGMDAGHAHDGTTTHPETGTSDTGTHADTGTSLDTGTSADTGLHNLDGGALCGNGVIDGNEECDDGNHYDLDGCDSSCHYEVVTRMTSVSISQTAGPAFCINNGNVLGTKAITSAALGQLNPPLKTDVDEGKVNVLTQFIGLSDLTGVSATGFVIGVMDGNPDPAKGTWPTAGNPIDWWFLADPTTVSNGLPTGVLGNAKLVSGLLTGGPSTVDLALNLGGSPANLTLRNATLAATINATPAPDVPAPPPAKLATGLTVFQTITATGADQGLCGAITVQSLAQIPVPSILATGTFACTQKYTACTGPVDATCNSLLDVIVGGCTVVVLAAVNPTQPDVPSGATVQKLTAGSDHKVTLPTMPDNDAYSAFLQFTANRAHFTGESCTTTAECQTGQTCTTGDCE